MAMISRKRLNSLIQKAESGDNVALSELQSYNKQIAKTANSRLSRLEKARLTYYAYERASAFTQIEYGTNRFSTSKSVLSDPLDLGQQIIEIETFLKSDTSKTGYIRQLFNDRIDFFRDRGVNIPKGQERRFFEFLDSIGAKTVKEYGSEQFIDDLERITNLNTKVDFDEIEMQFNKVAEGEITYDIALENLGTELF